jgi:Holliday junction resolvase
MGKMQLYKGNRFKRTAVNIFKAFDIPAQRVPLSGATEYAKGDIEITLHDKIYRIECKARAAGFKQIYAWLNGNDLLVIKADRSPALVVIGLEEFCQLVRFKE